MVDGNPADYDMAKLDDVLAKITHAAVDWMQDRPYEEYTFLYHFPRGYGAGGMEHAYGTAIDINAEHLRNDLKPLASVSAHEFFHLWNVKRIRPQSLEPIDYQARTGHAGAVVQRRRHQYGQRHAAGTLWAHR